MARLKPWEDSDESWAIIEPRLPEKQRRTRWPGRKRLDDRLALQGVLFVRPRRRPDGVLADRGYDHDEYRKQVRSLGVRPLIARRGTEHGSGLGEQRRVVKQAFALSHHFRRLCIRWEVRADIHESFLGLDCALICRRRLNSSRQQL